MLEEEEENIGAFINWDLIGDDKSNGKYYPGPTVKYYHEWMKKHCGISQYTHTTPHIYIYIYYIHVVVSCDTKLWNKSYHLGNNNHVDVD